MDVFVFFSPFLWGWINVCLVVVRGVFWKGRTETHGIWPGICSLLFCFVSCGEEKGGCLYLVFNIILSFSIEEEDKGITVLRLYGCTWGGDLNAVSPRREDIFHSSWSPASHPASRSLLQCELRAHCY